MHLLCIAPVSLQVTQKAVEQPHCSLFCHDRSPGLCRKWKRKIVDKKGWASRTPNGENLFWPLFLPPFFSSHTLSSSAAAWPFAQSVKMSEDACNAATAHPVRMGFITSTIVKDFSAQWENQSSLKSGALVQLPLKRVPQSCNVEWLTDKFKALGRRVHFRKPNRVSLHTPNQVGVSYSLSPHRSQCWGPLEISPQWQQCNNL